MAQKPTPSKEKATTLRTIAEEVGVSVMTVSRALHDHPDLSEATKSRIAAKAISLGYKKIPARNNKPSIKRVGLFLYAGASEPLTFEVGVRRTLFFAIETQCQKHQIEVVVLFAKSGDIPLSIKNKSIDAALLLGRYTAEDTYHFNGLPTLALSSFTAGSELPVIVADNIEGIRLTTRHLIELGHQNILFVGNDEGTGTELFRTRSEGYTLAMIEKGLKPRSIYVKLSELKSALPEIRKSTAIVCASDINAVLLSAALSEAGINVPGDISITGFDDIPEAAKITTYAPNWIQLGEAAVSLVAHSPELLKPHFKITIPGHLIIRESTAQPRARELPDHLKNLTPKAPPIPKLGMDPVLEPAGA